MLRSLLKTFKDKKRKAAADRHGGYIKDAVVTEVLDYDPHKLKRRLVERYDHVQESIRFSTSQRQDGRAMFMSESVDDMPLLEFFFQKRPDWVRVRWINITSLGGDEGRSMADQTLKMCALKYKLHPLALEDAIDCKYEKPKAESYAHRKFLMIMMMMVSWTFTDFPNRSF